MQCGISTSCFFPDNTATALQEVVSCGAPVTEVFLNTFSEKAPDFINKLAGIVKDTGTKIVSLHPFSSAMEGFFFATDYDGRMQDGIDLYREMFEACCVLGADKLVFHGDHLRNPRRMELGRYAEHFCELARVGQEYGVTLCHENVAYCRLATPDAVSELRPLLGEYAAFVLDIKQVLRAESNVPAMMQAMGKDIRHIHISDYKDSNDCIPPGEGEFDTAAFIKNLKSTGYTGDFIIELYRDGFTKNEQLTRAMQYMKKIVDNCSAKQ